MIPIFPVIIFKAFSCILNLYVSEKFIIILFNITEHIIPNMATCLLADNIKYVSPHNINKSVNLILVFVNNNYTK